VIEMAEEKVNQVVVMKDLTANPAALGLLGFGITTVL
jgi:succinate-acetate transporter protein